MRFLDTLLSWAGFVMLAAVALISPWLFGAWEMWWFWPFAVLLFLSTAFFGLRCLIWGTERRRRRLPADRLDWSRRLAVDVSDEPSAPAYRVRFPGMALWAVLSAAPFLVYAFARFQQAPVFMDAERSFLRYLTPYLLGLQVICGFDRRQQRMLFALLLTDLLLLGGYGIVNHFTTGNAMALWRPGYPQYQIGTLRATGSYFCPDHFSGLMELAIAGAAGLLLARERGWPWKLGGLLLLGVGLVGVALSKSRGGGLTILAMSLAVTVWGFGQWPPPQRWYGRLCLLSALAIGLVAFWQFGQTYVERFTSAEGWGGGAVRGDSWAETKTRLIARANMTSRGMMIAGAIRAWKSSPVVGIGPGMHQNLWPHFAASPDGNRDMGIWPSLPCNDFHSYEAHSDWVQFLEEYGAVGLGLFAIPICAWFAILLVGLRRERLARMANDWDKTDHEDHAALLAGLLAAVAMGFHSLGDFNLQIPATVWLLAAFVALALARVIRTYPDPVRPAAEDDDA
ncbi:MAG: O-antigen ligase family protein [Verrucomicrobiota bacterium]|nr:O-antigen ligase family protein [Verrucomicrobiota bacterium]